MSLFTRDPAGSRAMSSVETGALAAPSERDTATRQRPQLIELLRRRKILIVPLLILVAFVVVGLTAPYLAPLSPTETALGMKLTPPA